MRLTEHIVISIVSRSHLQTTRTELDIHIAVFNNRNHTVHQRHDDLVPLEPLVFRVLGVDTHGRITHDGFRTSRGHHCIISLGILVDHIAVSLKLFYVQ